MSSWCLPPSATARCGRLDGVDPRTLTPGLPPGNDPPNDRPPAATSAAGRLPDAPPPQLGVLGCVVEVAREIRVREVAPSQLLDEPRAGRGHGLGVRRRRPVAEL